MACSIEMFNQNVAFIVGCSRSGTTWLQYLLSELGGVHILGEANIGAYIREGCLSRITNMLKSNTYGDVFLDKTPSNVYDLPNIRKWFPRSRFVFMLRDPRAVITSIMYANWAKRRAGFSLDTAIRLWKRAGEEFIKAMPLLGNSIIVIQYEHLHCNTESVLRRVSQHFNIAFNNIDITRAVQNSTIVRMSKKTGGIKDRGFFRKGSLDSWKTDLSTSDVDKIIRSTRVLYEKLLSIEN